MSEHLIFILIFVFQFMSCSTENRLNSIVGEYKLIECTDSNYLDKDIRIEVEVEGENLIVDFTDNDPDTPPMKEILVLKDGVYVHEEKGIRLLDISFEKNIAILDIYDVPTNTIVRTAKLKKR